MKRMTFGSLFAGIGGFDLGFERAGLECRWQVEINPFCLRVLEKHWPSVPRFNDVTKFCRRIYDCEPENEEGEVWCPRCDAEFGECECIGTDQLLDECGPVDVICGCDPCQENSNARRTADTRSPSLGAEFIRIVDELRPRIVVRENPATVRADAPWPWWRFRSELERLGYAVLPFRLRACCIGADFRRERLFLLAELQGAERAGLEGNVREVVARADDGRQDAHAAGPDRWSAAPRICRGADRIPSKVDRLKGLGNAVVPQIAQWIGRRLIERRGEIT